MSEEAHRDEVRTVRMLIAHYVQVVSTITARFDNLSESDAIALLAAKQELRTLRRELRALRYLGWDDRADEGPSGDTSSDEEATSR